MDVSSLAREQEIVKTNYTRLVALYAEAVEKKKEVDENLNNAFKHLLADTEPGAQATPDKMEGSIFGDFYTTLVGVSKLSKAMEGLEAQAPKATECKKEFDVHKKTVDGLKPRVRRTLDNYIFGAQLNLYKLFIDLRLISFRQKQMLEATTRYRQLAAKAHAKETGQIYKPSGGGYPGGQQPDSSNLT